MEKQHLELPPRYQIKPMDSPMSQLHSDDEESGLGYQNTLVSD